MKVREKWERYGRRRNIDGVREEKEGVGEERNEWERKGTSGKGNVMINHNRSNNNNNNNNH